LQTRSPRFDAFFQTLREIIFLQPTTANGFRTSSPNVCDARRISSLREAR